MYPLLCPPFFIFSLFSAPVSSILYILTLLCSSFLHSVSPPFPWIPFSILFLLCYWWSCKRKRFWSSCCAYCYQCCYNLFDCKLHSWTIRVIIIRQPSHKTGKDQVTVTWEGVNVYYHVIIYTACILYTYLHTGLYTYIHTYMYMHTCSLNTYIHTCTYIHVHTYRYIHTCTYIYTRTLTHTHTNIHTYIHILTGIYIPIHTHVHTYM